MLCAIIVHYASRSNQGSNQEGD